MLERANVFGDPLAKVYEQGMMHLEGLELEMVGGPVRRTKKAIVIEGGLGDAVIARYWPAIKQHVEHQNIKLWLTDVVDPRDLRTSRSREPSVNRKNERIRKHLTEMKNLGVIYLNKGNPNDEKIYNNLIVDGAIIATWDSTHCNVASKWPGSARCIFIEKPLDGDIANVRAFKKALAKYGGETFPFGFDHYRTKALPLRQQMPHVLGWLGGEPDEFTFYLLESSTIENEGRIEALDKGLILDLFPHCLALMIYFGDPSTFQLDSIDGVRVGKYEGAQIDRETFASIRFTFKTHSGKLVNGRAYIGKGVRGVRRLERAGGVFESSPPKLLEVQAAGGGKVRLDFIANNFSVERDTQERTIGGLIANPHGLLLESFIFDRLPWDHSCFSIEVGETMLTVMGDIISKVPIQIPFYSTSDYLEDIMAKI